MGARKGSHGESGWNRKAELKTGVKMAGEGGSLQSYTAQLQGQQGLGDETLLELPEQISDKAHLH